MNIGETIRNYRLQKGMSQGDIEKRTGLLRCYLSRVENGHTIPSLDTLAKIAGAMEIALSQFFSESGHSNGSKNLPAALRRRSPLPEPDSPLRRQPERQRPQAGAGHGQEDGGEVTQLLAPRLLAFSSELQACLPAVRPILSCTTLL